MNKMLDNFIHSILSYNLSTLKKELVRADKDTKQEKVNTIKEQYNQIDLGTAPFVPTTRCKHFGIKPTIHRIQENEEGIEVQLSILLPLSIDELQDLVKETNFNIKDSKLTHKDDSTIEFTVDINEPQFQIELGKTVNLLSTLFIPHKSFKDVTAKMVAQSVKDAIQVKPTALPKFMAFPTKPTNEQKVRIETLLKNTDLSTITLDFLRDLPYDYAYLLAKEIYDRYTSLNESVPELIQLVVEKPNTYLNPKIYLSTLNELDSTLDV